MIYLRFGRIKLQDCEYLPCGMRR